eukprot:1916465-Pleurochrysis_carterae.AAC.1
MSDTCLRSSSQRGDAPLVVPAPALPLTDARRCSFSDPVQASETPNCSEALVQAGFQCARTRASEQIGVKASARGRWMCACMRACYSREG